MKEENLQAAIDQSSSTLTRHLEWVTRADSRLAFLIGIELAMLAYLASVADLTIPTNLWDGVLLTALGILKLASLSVLFISNFPNVKSPNKSLLFFGTIASMKFGDFRQAIGSQTPSEYLDDLASQIHVNAKILKFKFKCLKLSMIMMLLSVFPWLLLVLRMAGAETNL